MVRVEDARHQLGEREKMMERTSLFEILVVWTFDRFENLGGFFLVMINAAWERSIRDSEEWSKRGRIEMRIDSEEGAKESKMWAYRSSREWYTSIEAWLSSRWSQWAQRRRERETLLLDFTLNDRLKSALQRTRIQFPHNLAAQDNKRVDWRPCSQKSGWNRSRSKLGLSFTFSQAFDLRSLC